MQKYSITKFAFHISWPFQLIPILAENFSQISTEFGIFDHLWLNTVRLIAKKLLFVFWEAGKTGRIKGLKLQWNFDSTGNCSGTLRSHSRLLPRRRSRRCRGRRVNMWQLRRRSRRVPGYTRFISLLLRHSSVGRRGRRGCRRTLSRFIRYPDKMG